MQTWLIGKKKTIHEVLCNRVGFFEKKIVLFKDESVVGEFYNPDFVCLKKCFREAVVKK